jgi:hypothetical protein
MSPRIGTMSPKALQTIPFWQFAKAKRYHIFTFRVIFRTSLFFGTIYLAIHTGDYLHAHPLVSATGALRFLDRFEEVITDCVCDRIFPTTIGVS